MFFDTKPLSVFLIVLYILLLSWAVLLFFQEDKMTMWNYGFNVGYAFLYLTGGLIALVGLKHLGFKSTLGQQLLYFSIGLLGYTAGQFIWSFYNIVLKVDTPYPSIADAFFILYIPFIGMALANLLRVFYSIVTVRLILESIGVFALSTLIIFTSIGIGNSESGAPLLTRIFDILYPLGDITLITMIFLLIRVTQGRIHKSILYFIAALLVMVIADFTFTYRTSKEIYWNGDITDVLFATSGFLLSLGIIHVLSRIPKKQQSD